MKQKTATPAAIEQHPLLRQWIEVGENRCVRVMTGKVELGQGVSTALLQIACDGLGLEPHQVDLVAGHTGRSPDEGWTAGSLSIQYGGVALAWACAHAFHQFRCLAASRLGAEPQAVQVDAGVFSSANAVGSVDYWQLASEFSSEIRIVDPPPATREPTQPWKGRPVPRVDFAAKFTGAAYIQDLCIPGMQHARMIRGRHVDQRLKAIPIDELRSLDGVAEVVCSGQFLALVGPHEGRLVRALAKARKLVEFEQVDDPRGDHEVVGLLQSLPATTQRVHEAGAPGQALLSHSATYSRPYLAHASIGPSCAVADPREGRLRVWSHTQGVYQLRGQIAQVLGVDPSSVDVVHVPGAGCYGHNGADDAAFDAAYVAMTIGLPVRVQWMREDEMSVSPFGSASAVKLSAGIGEDGRICTWAMELWSHTHLNRPSWGDGINLLGAWQIDPPFPRPPAKDVPLPMGGGDRNAIAVYDLPHQAVDYHFIAQSPVRVSALRSLGSYANLFAIESFMDELAELQGSDPLEFRLRHLSDERAAAVLRRAVGMSRWDQRSESGTGSGYGIGFGRYKNIAAYCAVVAQVSVEERVRVQEVWIAVDAGAVVNPDGLANQIEGGALQSISWTLKEGVTWDMTGVTSCDWEHYPILGFDEIPEIHVQILEQPPTTASLGAGEASAGPAAAAVANAVAHALGLRARRLPLTPERLADLINAG